MRGPLDDAKPIQIGPYVCVLRHVGGHVTCTGAQDDLVSNDEDYVGDLCFVKVWRSDCHMI